MAPLPLVAWVGVHDEVTPGASGSRQGGHLKMQGAKIIAMKDRSYKNRKNPTKIRPHKNELKQAVKYKGSGREKIINEPFSEILSFLQATPMSPYYYRTLEELFEQTK